MGRGNPKVLAEVDFNYPNPPPPGVEAIMGGAINGKMLPPEKVTVKRKTVHLPVHNMRERDDLNLDTNGFVYEERPDLELADDKWNTETITADLLPKLSEFVKEVTGAELVIPGPFILRDVKVEKGKPAGSPFIIPAYGVHIDLNDQSSTDRARWLLKTDGKLGDDEVEAMMKKRLRVINIWKPVRGTVYDAPLAITDWKSIDQKRDLVPSRMMYPEEHKIPPLFMYSIRHHEDHTWWSIPEQRPEELLVFKAYDSAPGAACYIPHSAYRDPEWFGRLDEVGKERGVHAKPRESCEFRLWAWGGPEEPSA